MDLSIYRQQYHLPTYEVIVNFQYINNFYGCAQV